KLREYFMPRIVRPEDDDSFGIQRASGLPIGGSGGGQGFVPGKKVKTWRASPEIFPTQLTKETEQLLKAAVEAAVKAYGERSLPELEAEDKVAVAAEKAPTDDVVIQKLRAAYQEIKREYEEFTSREHDQVV
ncbi:MAG: preprotein translocase subunit SecA, partial [Dolichospermum sp.]